MNHYEVGIIGAKVNYILDAVYHPGIQGDALHLISTFNKFVDAKVFGAGESQEKLARGVVFGKDKVLLVYHADSPQYDAIREAMNDLVTDGIEEYSVYRLKELGMNDLAVFQEAPSPVVPVRVVINGEVWYEQPEPRGLRIYYILTQMTITTFDVKSLVDDINAVIGPGMVGAVGWRFIPYSSDALPGVLIRVFTQNSSDVRNIIDLLDSKYRRFTAKSFVYLPEQTELTDIRLL